MNKISSSEITRFLGMETDSSEINALYDELLTMNRPVFRLDNEEQDIYDFVLVRRKGIELGFADKFYFNCEPRYTWYQGVGVLTQVYFYSAVEDVAKCEYLLPYGLTWLDNRQQVVTKMEEHSSVHKVSNISDVWYLDNYLITANYNLETNVLDRIVCHLPQPVFVNKNKITSPDFLYLAKHLSENINTKEFKAAFQGYMDDLINDAFEYDEIDLIEEFGIQLNTSSQTDELRLHSIIFFSNGEFESTGWKGKLPFDLKFTDSPLQLFQKINSQPRKSDDDVNDGYAVWDFEQFSLHVLYSNFKNSILRVTIMIPYFDS